MIPCAPGYWGLYEIGVVTALALLEIQKDASVAFGYSLIIHFFQIVPIAIIGLYYLWKEGFSLAEISDQLETQQHES